VFDTVLVADRGLAACRVVRTCQRLGARAVTVHSTTDSTCLHSTCADESVPLGAADPAASYLDGLKVIEAARQAGAQAVHPGQGALAASAPFAQAVRDAGLGWVGPPPSVLAEVARQANPGRRTVDVTVLGLPDGSVVVLGDSAVTAGRSQAPADLAAELRELARSTAAGAAHAVGLAGLATVEVVLDESTGAPPPARLRAWLAPDHPVVELVSGVDLVEQQLLLAAGDEPSYDAVVPPGGVAGLVALRARTAGRLTGWQEPAGDGIRVDTGYREGDDVSPYDGVLATLSAWGPTAERARARLQEAREQFVISGIELDEEGRHP
jgi:acetyl/propionyl-CoA carboxylase alpha subunit